jgi:hypothetical protein
LTAREKVVIPPATPKLFSVGYVGQEIGCGGYSDVFATNLQNAKLPKRCRTCLARATLKCGGVAAKLGWCRLGLGVVAAFRVPLRLRCVLSATLEAMGGHGLRGNVAAWRQILGGAELAKMTPDSSYNVQRIQIKIAALQIATINQL